MDSIVFEESVNTEVSTSEFVDKQWLYVNDNNNGSYSSQIVLDTTPLSNSGAYINWSESFILIPLVLQVESPAAVLTAGLGADFMVALKSGYWNILHSLTCEFNNGNIIQQVPFLNVFCSFKNLTSWSLNDVVNWGDVCGFHKDSAKSWAFSGAAAAATLANRPQAGGVGLSNNRNAPYVDISFYGATIAVPAAFGDPITPLGVNRCDVTQATRSAASILSEWNEGMWCRQEAITYSSVLTAADGESSNKGVLMDDGNAAQLFRSYIVRAAQIRSYAIDSIVRLKDVADFFCKCPLLKGSTMRIYLNTNQVSFPVNLVGATFDGPAGGIGGAGALATYGSATLASAPVILGGGGTNPVMFASADVGQGGSVLTPLVDDSGGAAATTAVATVSLSIVRTQFTGQTVVSAPLTSCRLYAPAYTFNPIAEQRYLSLTPTKKVIYNDIFQFQFNNQNTNSPFNILVTNGIPNIRSVLVVPQLGQANGPAGASSTSSLLSPFCSSPASPDPLAISNVQIQVSGKNLFINQLQYDFEVFCEQLVSSNQLNGSLTTSMSSGLISKSDFQSLYRYYYGNTSRSLPSEDGVAKAIQISGTILSPTGAASLSCNLMVFVEFEREIVIDVRTGARVA